MVSASAQSLRGFSHLVIIKTKLGISKRHRHNKLGISKRLPTQHRTTMMTGNNTPPTETKLAFTTSKEMKEEYITTCKTPFLKDNDTGSIPILPSGTRLQKWMNSEENEQNMAYINLMDMHKSRGYINDDKIIPIKNWCEIDASDDDNIDVNV